MVSCCRMLEIRALQCRGVASITGVGGSSVRQVWVWCALHGAFFQGPILTPALGCAGTCNVVLLADGGAKGPSCSANHLLGLESKVPQQGTRLTRVVLCGG